jgi:hypothetical protein
MINVLFILPLALFVALGCVHVDAGKRKKAAEKRKMERYAKKRSKNKKKISYKYSANFKPNTKVSYVVESALERGQPTIAHAARHLRKHKNWKAAHKYVASILWKLSKQQKVSARDNARLLRASILYQESPFKAQSKLVESLLSATFAPAIQVGLLISAGKPNHRLKIALDNYLSNLLSAGDNALLHNPLIADAVQANRMLTSYTLMKQNLLETGDESFARAMANLYPQRASRDFLDYLNLANYEELRQLHLTSVDIMTCNYIFNHLARYTVPVQDPNFVVLFLYATSRNKALGDLAHKALQPLISRHRHHLASLLARMPPNVQISFVAAARHSLTPQKKLFLRDFRRITANEDVHFEVDSLRL